jgi:F0F1-type ATP synthase delta subunit
MTYVRFSPINRNQWNMFTLLKSAKPIATVKRHNGTCSATIKTTRKLNRAELTILSAFMRKQEA